MPGARRVTEGAAAMGRFFVLNMAKAETRFWLGGAMEPSSWTLRVSAAVLRTPSGAASVFPFLGAASLAGFLAAAGFLTAAFFAGFSASTSFVFFVTFFSILLKLG